MFLKKKTADTPFVIFYYRNAVLLQRVHSVFLGGHAREFLLSTESYSNSTVLEHGFSIFSQQTNSYSLSVRFARRKTRDHIPLHPGHLQAAVSSHRPGPLRQGKRMHCSTARVLQELSFKALGKTRSGGVKDSHIKNQEHRSRFFLYPD
jgi:hypothetical protein